MGAGVVGAAELGDHRLVIADAAQEIQVVISVHVVDQTRIHGSVGPDIAGPTLEVRGGVAVGIAHWVRRVVPGACGGDDGGLDGGGAPVGVESPEQADYSGDVGAGHGGSGHDVEGSGALVHRHVCRARSFAVRRDDVYSRSCNVRLHSHEITNTVITIINYIVDVDFGYIVAN